MATKNSGDNKSGVTLTIHISPEEMDVLMKKYLRELHNGSTSDVFQFLEDELLEDLDPFVRALGKLGEELNRHVDEFLGK